MSPPGDPDVRRPHRLANHLCGFPGQQASPVNGMTFDTLGERCRKSSSVLSGRRGAMADKTLLFFWFVSEAAKRSSSQSLRKRMALMGTRNMGIRSVYCTPQAADCDLDHPPCQRWLARPV